MGAELKNLKKLRLEKKLSQQALAEKFNITQQSIYKYENGLAEPDLELLKKISCFFGVSIDYLVGNSDNSSVSDAVITFSPTEDELSLIRYYRRLDPELKSALVSIITRLSK